MPELQALFAAADQEEYDLFQFFLCTGCRDGEVQHATWADLDFHRNLYTVKERLDLGFRPKDKEEASIPLPDQFVARMKARRASCARFGVHRFRKTFATMHHEGVLRADDSALSAAQFIGHYTPVSGGKR